MREEQIRNFKIICILEMVLGPVFAIPQLLLYPHAKSLLLGAHLGFFVIGASYFACLYTLPTLSYKRLLLLQKSNTYLTQCLIAVAVFAPGTYETPLLAAPVLSSMAVFGYLWSRADLSALSLIIVALYIFPAAAGIVAVDSWSHFISGLLFVVSGQIILWTLGPQIVRYQRHLRHIAHTSRKLGLDISQAIEHIYSGTLAQNDEAQKQAVTMAATSHAIGHMIDVNEKISTAAQEVLHHAHATKAGFEQSQDLAKRLRSISMMIRKLSGNIRDISGRSEVLALNAALEGEKAGEQSQGFLLVANELQRLAEGISDSVSEISSLTDEITGHTDESESAAKADSFRAEKTTASASRIVSSVNEHNQATDALAVQLREASQRALDIASKCKRTFESVQAINRSVVQFQKQMGTDQLKSPVLDADSETLAA